MEGDPNDTVLDWAYQKFDNDPYIQGAAPYVDKAIEWARQTGLKVWIDLHGAPESQNGYDNSGHLTKMPGWEQGDTVKQTLLVLQQISNKYATAAYQDVVVAIELLNEPQPALLPSLDILKQFYRDGYGEVRFVSDTPVALHDAFQPSSSWNGFLTPSDNNAQNGTYRVQSVNTWKRSLLMGFSHHRSPRVPNLFQRASRIATLGKLRSTIL